MASIVAGAVARLKDDVQRFLSVAFVTQLAVELGLCWRQTTLALPNLVALFARQILGGNLSMPELARLAGSTFTPEAYCTARGRLPLELLQELLRRVCILGEQAVQATGAMLWKGHRLWHMDGSSFSMADNGQLQEHFGQPGQQRQACGFPVAHILCLFDAASGLIHDCILSPLRTHDMAHAAQLHPRMRRGDVLIADRAFESFVHLALLLGQGLHLIAPVHQKRKVDFRRKERRSGKNGRRLERQRVRKLGRCDQVFRWRKPPHKPRWASQALFDALPSFIEVREIKRQVRLPTGLQQTITLVSTLLDPVRYPAEELVAVLKGRWAVEVNLRHLKTTMQMEILRSQTVAGIEKELYMFLIVYNLVRLVMLQASARQAVPVDRLSFADALYWVRHGDLSLPLPELQVVPYRPERVEPRAVKRRPKEYARLNRPRQEMRKQLHRRKKRLF
jgi:hypothetical protein